MGRKAHPSFAETEAKEKKFMSFLQVTNQNKESTKMALKLAKKLTNTNLMELNLEADQAALMKLIGILTRIQDETLVKKSNTIEHLRNINEKYQELKKTTEEEKANKEAIRALLIKEKAINEKLQEELVAAHKKEAAARAEELNVVNILERIVEERLINNH